MADITATGPGGRKIKWNGKEWVPVTTFSERLRSAAWERPGDIAAEKPPVLDSGENPALGNVPGSASGKFPLREGVSEAGSLANAGMMLMGGESRMGMPKGASPLEAVKGAGRVAKTAGKELTGTGPSMERLQAAKDLNALPLKQSLSDLSNAVRTDASRILDSAVKQTDAAHPQGVVSKAEFGPKVEEILKGFVKTSEKPPSPIAEMSEGAPESQLAKASVFRPSSSSLGDLATAMKTGAAKGIKVGATAQQRINEFLDQIGESPITEEGPRTPTDGWTAQQLQQLRSKLFNAAYGSKSQSLTGSMRTAADGIYKLASETLDNATKKADANTAWKVGNEKWKAYKETFDGKWERGQFHESPISKALSGQTADDILGPLEDKGSQWTRDLLKRYSKFGADTQKVASYLNRHHWLSMIERFSRPSKYEMMATPVAALDPTFFARLAATRFLTPPLLRWLATRGINVENVRGYQPIEPGLPKGGQ
jgi:hypothetical protein